MTNTAVTMIQIAMEKFSEATVGYGGSRDIAEKWVQLFSTPYFMVTPVRNFHASSHEFGKRFSYRVWSGNNEACVKNRYMMLKE